MKKRYRVWDGHDVLYFAFLTDAEVISLRRQGYRVTEA
jgi:hypothetical protein